VVHPLALCVVPPNPYLTPDGPTLLHVLRLRIYHYYLPVYWWVSEQLEQHRKGGNRTALVVGYGGSRTDRQTERQTDRQTDRHKGKGSSTLPYLGIIYPRGRNQVCHFRKMCRPPCPPGFIAFARLDSLLRASVLSTPRGSRLSDPRPGDIGRYGKPCRASEHLLSYPGRLPPPHPLVPRPATRDPRPMGRSQLGISAPQGCGKTTIVEQLELLFNWLGRPAASVSIDDFYLTYADQNALAAANPGNRLLQLRGNAGTHDLALGTETLRKLHGLSEKGATVAVPRCGQCLGGGGGRWGYKRQITITAGRGGGGGGGPN
jgi:hypothetical protein